MKSSRPPLLPPEHGAWAFLLLPTLSGLALRPSRAGLALFGMGLIAFLGRMPFRRIARARTATTFDRWWMLLYALAALLCLGFTLGSVGVEPLLPLLPAIPLGAWLLRVDIRGSARSLLAEWATIAVPSLLGVAMVRAGQGTWPLALVLGTGSFISLAAPVTYLRARLARRRGGQGDLGLALVIHGVAFLAALALRMALPRTPVLGWLWPAWMGLLLLRPMLEPRIEKAIPDPRSLGIRESLVCAISSLALVLCLRGL